MKLRKNEKLGVDGKVWSKDSIQALLRTNDKAVIRGLVRIFLENQTSFEQNSEAVLEDNGIGFTGVDGNFLSSLAKQVISGRTLSEKQMVHLRKKMPKYWRQLLTFIPSA